MARLAREVAIHLEKARESAFLAVETYNRPRTSFRSGGYIVLMCIAWTALFHAIFFKRNVKPFYRKKAIEDISKLSTAIGRRGSFPNVSRSSGERQTQQRG